MKNRTFIILLFTFTALYLFLFPSPLKKEMAFVPKWSTDAGNVFSGMIPEEGRLYPFVVPDENRKPVLGFIGDNGELSYTEKVYYKAAVCGDGFINYSSAGGSLVLQDPSGMVLSTVETDGFPYLRDQWFLVISRDRKRDFQNKLGRGRGLEKAFRLNYHLYGYEFRSASPWVP